MTPLWPRSKRSAPSSGKGSRLIVGASWTWPAPACSPYLRPRQGPCAAVEIQAVLAQRNEARPEARRMRCRVGVKVGEVKRTDGIVYGNGVNVAA
jgi:hypothetical protein